MATHWIVKEMSNNTLTTWLVMDGSMSISVLGAQQRSAALGTQKFLAQLEEH